MNRLELMQKMSSSWSIFRRMLVDLYKDSRSWVKSMKS